MHIGPPRNGQATRLLVARTLAALSPSREPRELELAIAHRVKRLRGQVERGTYQVDPDRLATSVYQAVLAGGL